MDTRVLITGGAGFIGSHVASELLARGYRVRALDALVPQVHGDGAPRRPAYLHTAVELCEGDVTDPDAVASALADVDAVVHLAAAVGVGQSMYEVVHYTRVNALGTAVLLEALAAGPVRRLVVASSMSVYGEGLYRDASGRRHVDVTRSLDHLREGLWDPMGADGAALESVPTHEDVPPSLTSVYALSKYDQERLCLMLGRAYDIPTIALRFFNVYGRYQALSNPYTGVLAIFAARLLNDRPPLIFEDGQQRRDFVSVLDVARACRAALEADIRGQEVVNVGSGVSMTIREVAERLARVLGKDIEPVVTGEHRLGDIRHCYADVRRARDLIGFEPRVAFDDGLADLAAWLAHQRAVDGVDQARRELSARGLAV
jgi:dTDP-L-rhamnose 4-epimerase